MVSYRTQLKREIKDFLLEEVNLEEASSHGSFFKDISSFGSKVADKAVSLFWNDLDYISSQVDIFSREVDSFTKLEDFSNLKTFGNYKSEIYFEFDSDDISLKKVLSENIQNFSREEKYKIALYLFALYLIKEAREKSELQVFDEDFVKNICLKLIKDLGQTKKGKFLLNKMTGTFSNSIPFNLREFFVGAKFEIKDGFVEIETEKQLLKTKSKTVDTNIEKIKKAVKSESNEAWNDVDLDSVFTVEKIISDEEKEENKLLEKYKVVEDTLGPNKYFSLIERIKSFVKINFENEIKENPLEFKFSKTFPKDEFEPFVVTVHCFFDSINKEKTKGSSNQYQKNTTSGRPANMYNAIGKDIEKKPFDFNELTGNEDLVLKRSGLASVQNGKVKGEYLLEIKFLLPNEILKKIKETKEDLEINKKSLEEKKQNYYEKFSKISSSYAKELEQINLYLKKVEPNYVVPETNIDGFINAIEQKANIKENFLQKGFKAKIEEVDSSPKKGSQEQTKNSNNKDIFMKNLLSRKDKILDFFGETNQTKIINLFGELSSAIKKIETQIKRIDEYEKKFSIRENKNLFKNACNYLMELLLDKDNIKDKLLPRFKSSNDKDFKVETFLSFKDEEEEVTQKIKINLTVNLV